MFIALLVIAQFVPVLVAALTPSIFQVDLIFPRANETYKPVFPFPIVYLLRNISSVWVQPREEYLGYESPVYFDWDMGNATTSYGFGLNENKTPWPQVAPPDSLLVIDSIDIVNRTSHEVQLSGWIYVQDNCSFTTTASGAVVRHESFYERKQIPFKFDPINGKEVDFLSGGSCPSHFLSVEITGTNKTLPGGQNVTVDGPGYCPIVSNPSPAPNPCNFVINREVDQMIREKMLEHAFCTEKSGWKNVSWPGPNGRVDYCEPWNTNIGTTLSFSLTLCALLVLGYVGNVLLI